MSDELSLLFVRLKSASIEIPFLTILNEEFVRKLRKMRKRRFNNIAERLLFLIICGPRSLFPSKIFSHRYPAFAFLQIVVGPHLSALLWLYYRFTTYLSICAIIY
jgi:hypothetical protein